MFYNIKCTDKRHVSRKNHINVEVRKKWFDGVIARSSVKRTRGKYAEICEGCALANQIDDVPEFKQGPTLEERVKLLETR